MAKRHFIAFNSTGVIGAAIIKQTLVVGGGLMMMIKLRMKLPILALDQFHSILINSCRAFLVMKSPLHLITSSNLPATHPTSDVE
jgi:hypothetical protein